MILYLINHGYILIYGMSIYDLIYVAFQFRCCDCVVYVFVSWIVHCICGLGSCPKSPFLDCIFLAKILKGELFVLLYH